MSWLRRAHSSCTAPRRRLGGLAWALALGAASCGGPSPGQLFASEADPGRNAARLPDPAASSLGAASGPAVAAAPAAAKPPVGETGALAMGTGARGAGATAPGANDPDTEALCAAEPGAATELELRRVERSPRQVAERVAAVLGAMGFDERPAGLEAWARRQRLGGSRTAFRPLRRTPDLVVNYVEHSDALSVELRDRRRASVREAFTAPGRPSARAARISEAQTRPIAAQLVARMERVGLLAGDWRLVPEDTIRRRAGRPGPEDTSRHVSWTWRRHHDSLPLLDTELRVRVDTLSAEVDRVVLADVVATPVAEVARAIPLADAGPRLRAAARAWPPGPPEEITVRTERQAYALRAEERRALVAPMWVGEVSYVFRRGGGSSRSPAYLMGISLADPDGELVVLLGKRGS